MHIQPSRHDTMNELETFIEQIKSRPETIGFNDVIAIVDKYYHYTPTRFVNGTDNDNVISDAGENEGSCKIFSFAQKHHLDQAQTLNCFGQYYRDDVLNSPAGSDHANIRTFMRYGWDHISFDKPALDER